MPAKNQKLHFWWGTLDEPPEYKFYPCLRIIWLYEFFRKSVGFIFVDFATSERYAFGARWVTKSLNKYNFM
jgi:hypothetical protein